MSNVKRIHLEAELPWNWITLVDDQDARTWATLTLNDVMGVKLTQTDIGMAPYALPRYLRPPDLGYCSMRRVLLAGEEAIAFTTLEMLVCGWADVPTARVLDAWAADLENGGPNETIAGSRWNVLGDDLPRSPLTYAPRHDLTAGTHLTNA